MKRKILLISLMLVFSLGIVHVAMAQDDDCGGCTDTPAPATTATPGTPPATPSQASNPTPPSTPLQASNPSPSSGPIQTLQNPLKATSITGVILSLVDLAIFIGTIVAVLTFIYIGFKFVLAQGDPKALTEARKWFFYAVIGTAILISSKVIVTVIQQTLVSAGVVNQNVVPLQ